MGFSPRPAWLWTLNRRSCQTLTFQGLYQVMGNATGPRISTLCFQVTSSAPTASRSPGGGPSMCPAPPAVPSWPGHTLCRLGPPRERCPVMTGRHPWLVPIPATWAAIKDNPCQTRTALRRHQRLSDSVHDRDHGLYIWVDQDDPPTGQLLASRPRDLRHSTEPSGRDAASATRIPNGG